MTDHHDVTITFNNGRTLNLTLDEANYSYLNKIMWHLDSGRSVKIQSEGWEYIINPNNVCMIAERMRDEDNGEIQ